MSERIAMVVFSYYPSDPRVRREAEALVNDGYRVDVLCLKNEDEPREETIKGVQVHRLALQRKRAGRLRYLWEYFCYITFAFFKLSLLHIKTRYQVVHVHNMPDILVFSALIARCTGAKVILDLHDPMPEVYMSKYNLGPSHPVIKAITTMEKWSIGFAHLVLTPNIAFRELFVARGCPVDKIQVVMNSPQEHIFKVDEVGDTSTRSAHDGEQFNLMYHGLITERHGLDTALKAVAQVRESIPNLVFNIYGTGDDFLHRVHELVRSLNVEDIVKYHGYKSQEEIAEAIKSIDFGIIPNKKTPFTEINMPTRIFEYLALAKPLIAPRTKGIKDYFDEDALFFFEPGNEADLAETLLQIYQEPDRTKTVLKEGLDIYHKHRWQHQQEHFVGLVKELLPSSTGTHSIKSTSFWKTS